jgi:hypothetical protein
MSAPNASGEVALAHPNPLRRLKTMYCFDANGVLLLRAELIMEPKDAGSVVTLWLAGSILAVMEVK